jgi:hypothetical protein
MKDLIPLLEGSASERTRALLAAGRGDVPPEGFANRLLVGLGLGVAASGVSVTAAAGTAGVVASVGTTAAGSAATSGVAASLSVVGAKWVVVGVIGGGLLAGGADLALSSRFVPAPVTSAPGPERAAVLPSVAAQPGPAPLRIVPAELPAVAAQPEPGKLGTGGPVATPSGQTGQLGREVQVIDRARQALASGNALQALRELDAFERMASSGVLDREAQVLRIEALHRSGQKARARQLSEQYRGAFPNDAHAARLRSLEEEP